MNTTKLPLRFSNKLKKKYPNIIGKLLLQGRELWDASKEESVYCCLLEEWEEQSSIESFFYFLFRDEFDLSHPIPKSRSYRIFDLLDKHLNKQLEEEVKSIIRDRESFFFEQSKRSFNLLWSHRSEEGPSLGKWVEKLVDYLYLHPDSDLSAVNSLLEMTPFKKDWLILPLKDTLFFTNHISLPFYKGVEQDFYISTALNWDQVIRKVDDLFAFISIIQDFIAYQEQDFLFWREFHTWNEIFEAIPNPSVIFNNKGETLYYNQQFSSLGILPKDYFDSNDGDSVEIHQKKFRLTRIEDFENESNIYLIFSRVDSKEGINLSENPDLGIMTSSLAHELKNPLAGILAALNVLELEVEESEGSFDQDAIQLLSEMKKTVYRTKNLVETFLGFSRKQDSIYSSQLFEQSKELSLKEHFIQAMDLLRFPMVEKNLKLQYKYSQEGYWIHSYNPSMMVMMFYLFFSQLLLESSQHELVTDRIENEGFTMIERDEYFVIKGNIFKGKELQAGKLFYYILQNMGVDLSRKDDEILFKVTS